MLKQRQPVSGRVSPKFTAARTWRRLRVAPNSELFHYQQHIRAMQFERAGLLRAFQVTYPATTVLYPGCFI
jgi:hypothetical protein